MNIRFSRFCKGRKILKIFPGSHKTVVFRVYRRGNDNDTSDDKYDVWLGCENCEQTARLDETNAIVLARHGVPYYDMRKNTWLTLPEPTPLERAASRYKKVEE